MGENPDGRLVKAVGGSADALTELLRDHGPTLRGRFQIEPLHRSLLDIDDILQVTYLEAFLHIRQFRGNDESAFVSWLTRIAHNNLRDAVRELERGKRPDPRRRVWPSGSDESYVGLLDEIGHTSQTPSRVVAAAEARHILEGAIARLPESYRTVVNLCDLEGQGAEEVAREVGRSPGAVYMLRARAHDRLRAILGSPSRF